MRALARELGMRADEVARVPLLLRLADHLEHHLVPILERPLTWPGEKAQLSRDGGVCATDGARLLFDPLTPHVHVCPRCHAAYEGARHDRAWTTRYQLWLSERAVHGALLGALRARPSLARRAAEILGGYAARYRSYPNRDNVLGPTRLFFSTYLESIWLIQVTTAAALLDTSTLDVWGPGDRAAVAEMVAESAALIGAFDEGWSNRQVWNAAAVLAAGTWLGDGHLRRAGLDGRSGVRALLAGIDEDGLWHEGENYHLFALRGFLLAAEWARWGDGGDGASLYRHAPLGRMYAAPLATLLPNLEVPARGDAPFGSSVRQQRFAELWEVGRARAADPRLDAVLARLYDDDLPEAPDVGGVELAEQEEHRPAGRLRRDRLGWKALLWMVPAPPTPTCAVWDTGATLLPAHGVAMLRPRADAMVSLECGRARGGHGHPDLLHLSLYWGAYVLADFGTGSYVSPSLFWYRSTLAHNAPGVAGIGQAGGVAWCERLDAVNGWSWMRVSAQDVVGDGTLVRRSVLVGHDLVIDEVIVSAGPECVVDLPLHPLGGLEMHAEAGPVSGDRSGGPESGYDRIRVRGRLRDPYRPRVLAGDGAPLTTWMLERPGEEVILAEAAGPPGSDLGDGLPTPFLVRRAAGSGRWVTVYAGGAADVTRVSADRKAVRVHGRSRSWSITGNEGGVTVVADDGVPVRLAGRGSAPPDPVTRPSFDARRVVPVRRVTGAVSLDAWPPHARFVLGRDAYRRSEADYGEWGPFSALVDLVVSDACVVFLVDVTKDPLVVRPADAPDPALDNESADIHSDGMQCYLGIGGWQGYVVLPDLDRGRLRPRAVAGTAADAQRVSGACRRTATGYRMLVRCDVGRVLDVGERFPFTAVINEMRPGRERRAGQLAMTGGGWVYLRGDRESAATALVAEVA